MSRTTHTTRRALFSAAVLTLSALALGASHPLTAANEPARPDRAAYYAAFQGVGAEGRDMIWQGAIAGAAVGELTVRLAHVSADGASRPGPQPVEGILFVSGEPERSFAAEVTGTMDLPAQRVELAGQISEGYRRGERVVYTAELIDLDLSGELRFAPAIAAAR